MTAVGMTGPTATATDPLALLLLAVALVNLALALLVLRAARGPREEPRVFATLALAVSLWCLTNALFRLAPTVGAATLWAQLAYLSALATGAAFLHFAWIYPRRMAVSPRQKATVWLLGVLIGLFAFLPGVVIKSIDLEARRILTGPGLLAITAYMFLTSTIAFSLFFSHQNSLRGRARAQARYVLYGSLLTAVLGLAFNLVLPLWNDYRFVGIGPLASLFFVGFSGYSIAAHRLFDVRLLIRRTLVYTILLALLAGALAAVEKGLEQLLHPLLGRDGSLSTDIVAALLVSLAIDPVKRWLEHRVAARLFKAEKEEMENMRNETS